VVRAAAHFINQMRFQSPNQLH